MSSAESSPRPLRPRDAGAPVVALIALLLLPGCFLRSSITVRNRSQEPIESARLVVTSLGGPVERERDFPLAPGEDREWRLPAFTGESRLEVEVQTPTGRSQAECGRVELHSYHFFVVYDEQGLHCTFDS